MSFEQLKVEVSKGLDGRNGGIPMGFERLNRYISIRKSTYILVGGLTGSGKTSLVDDAFVLNPYDWIISEDGRKSGIELEIIYRSMERSKLYKLAKWTSRRMFIDEAADIPIGKLLGWKGFDKLTKDEHDLFLSYEGYFEEMKSKVTIIDGPENPVGIAKELKAHAEKHGKFEQIDQYNKIYIPNNPNKITILIIDHIGLLKLTKEFNTKKAAIDKLSSELRYARDMYGYVVVPISQFNREIANPIRIKNGDVEPNLEDFKDSSSTQEDADIVLALFDPMRYKVEDPSGYKLDMFRDSFGAKYYRSLRLIKNSFGEDDLRIGLGFHGKTGIFKELPKAKDMEGFDYQALFNGQYFL